MQFFYMKTDAAIRGERWDSQRAWSLALLTVAQLASGSTALADAIGIFAGHGQDADQYGIGIQLDRRTPVHESATSTWTCHLELGIGEFQGRKSGITDNTTRALEAVAELG
jgi:hypothetical protein